MLRALAAVLALAAPPKGAAPTDAPPRAPDAYVQLEAETRGFRAGHPVRPQVVPGGAEVIFLRSGPRSGVQSLWATDLATGATRELLPADALTSGGEPGDAERARLERQRITSRGITHARLSKDGRWILVAGGGAAMLLEREGGARRRLPLPPGALDPRLSPDGRSLAYVSGGELHVLDLDSGTSRAVTTGAGEWRTHGLAEFVAQEEMRRSEGYWWSPDSDRLAFEEADDEKVEKLSIADPARPEKAPVRFAYPRAGRENSRVRLGVVERTGGAPTWIEWDRERFPYLAEVRWERGGPLLLLVQDRSQTEEQVLRADPSTGRTQVLLVEKD